MTIPVKNGHSINLVKIGGSLALIVPLIITLCTLVYRVGVQTSVLESATIAVQTLTEDVKEIDVRINKTILPLLGELRDKIGILQTKINDQTEEINKIFITENMMRDEIQHLAENKVDKSDFYRYKTEMNSTLTKIGNRILYIERENDNTQ